MDVPCHSRRGTLNIPHCSVVKICSPSLVMMKSQRAKNSQTSCILILYKVLFLGIRLKPAFWVNKWTMQILFYIHFFCTLKGTLKNPCFYFLSFNRYRFCLYTVLKCQNTSFSHHESVIQTNRPSAIIYFLLLYVTFSIYSSCTYLQPLYTINALSIFLLQLIKLLMDSS